jgi:PAT family beta-lactamase induction signal transducer AmpG
VPSLYFSQGIPYVIVMTMSVVMYKRLGISNTDIALYTSWLYLPWVIKPLWSPLVDITRTKRFWIVAMQFLVALALAMVAFSVRGSGFFQWSLFLFWIMAFASATHDIAADGFYMLSLPPHEQAWWVGLRSTFYRTAMVVGTGLLVVLAGVLESRNGLRPADFSVTATATAAANDRAAAMDSASFAPPGGSASPQIILQPAALEIPAAANGVANAAAVLSHALAWNRDNGFLDQAGTQRNHRPPRAGLAEPLANHLLGPAGKFWSSSIAQPLAQFLKSHFARGPGRHPSATGPAGVVRVALSKPPAPGKEVVVQIDPRKSGLQLLGLARADGGFTLSTGGRLVFNQTNWNRGAMAVVEMDGQLAAGTAMGFQATAGNIPLAWSTTLFLVAAIFLAFSCWHSVMLPRPPNDGPVISHRSRLAEFFATLGSFFQKPGVLLALAFILFYRFDEAQLSKVISPFLLDARDAGGLGLTTAQVGLAYGTVGILALTAGGLLGGFLAAKHGLKKMLPVMVASMYLPKCAFVFLAFTQPDNFLVVGGAVAAEQFGYGFGFTAFMLYLLYFADGPHKTAHYALCTGFMALGMMIPGMWSGWLVDIIGYKHFFVWVIVSTLPGLLLATRLKIDPAFGAPSRSRPQKAG